MQRGYVYLYKIRTFRNSLLSTAVIFLRINFIFQQIDLSLLDKLVRITTMPQYKLRKYSKLSLKDQAFNTKNNTCYTIKDLDGGIHENLITVS